VIYAGIDEAGYGPLLGPLCVGMSAFRLSHGDAALPPDLWSRWSTGVCRAPRDKRRRIAVADSKRLKSAGKTPLIHLERGVLSFVERAVASDAALFAELGVHAPCARATPWHARELALPESHTQAELAIARNVVRRALERAGDGLAAFGVTALDAPAFNELYRRIANKSLLNMSLVFEAARHVDLLRGDEPAYLAIDRQGGRASYAAELEEHVARGVRVRTIHEDDERSTYLLGEGLTVSFEVAAEERHLPVALASMGAKFVRERSMARLNAFFADRVPGLEPTAGYVEDGRRFLAEVKPVLLREAIPEADFARVV
jgi:ribonuclease HII